MKKLLTLGLGVLMFSAPAFAQSPAANDMKSAFGTVSAVSNTSLSLKADGKIWTFGVNPSTMVTVKGATRKMAALKDNNQPPVLGEFVRVGDLVDVRYLDKGDMKHAADIHVRSSIPLLSAPANAPQKAQKADADKTMTAAGVVSAVNAEWLTIKAKGAEWKFAIDKATHVSAPGASRKTAALKDEKKPAQITEYVKVGDSVTVRYHDLGATKHAADVIVRGSLPATKK